MFHHMLILCRRKKEQTRYEKFITDKIILKKQRTLSLSPSRSPFMLSTKFFEKIYDCEKKIFPNS